MSKIAFIGGGQIAKIIVDRFIACGRQAADMIVVDPNNEKKAHFIKQYGIKVCDDTTSACETAEIIILAIKPQNITDVADKITFDLSGKLIISLVAGVTTARLQNLFGSVAIVRAMPNTPALLGLGATGFYVNAETSGTQRSEAENLFNTLGIAINVQNEEQLDAVTAVSGSGPAYYFLMMEEMIRTAIVLGLSQKDATALTVQTALGAATMVTQGHTSPQQLRAQVTSPNGTTYTAINTMQENGFAEVISKGMIACRDRAIELGKGQFIANYSTVNHVQTKV